MPRDLTIFVGFAKDARDEATGIRGLEQQLDAVLGNLNKVLPGEPTYHRVRIFNWEYDADSVVGGQAQAITPHLENASIAVFVFKHRVGAVTWKELDDIRDRPENQRIPVLVLFTQESPNAESMQDENVVEQWLQLLRRKSELTADWGDNKSRSVTPLETYLDIEHLLAIVGSRLENILPTIVADRQQATDATHPQPVDTISPDGSPDGEVPFLDRTTAITDFDRDAVEEFRSNLRSEFRDQYPSGLTDIEFIQRSGLFHNGRLTNCGVLLFARSPTLVLPSAATRAIVFEGTDKTAARNRNTFSGPLLSQITASRAFIEDSIEKRERPSVGSMKAETLYKYPMICVREMIANAVCHREYDHNERMTYVRLFADRLEITSPGSWTGRELEEDEVIPLGDLAGQSVQRNMRLAQAISSVDVVEMEGSGIPSSISECRALSAAEPTVLYSDGYVTLTVYPRTSWGEAVEFYSCFISHAAEDREFAMILYDELTRRGVRCWLASQDIMVGDDIQEAIDSSIKRSDKVVVILSETSLQSDWVELEVNMALKIEKNTEKHSLIPIALDDAAFGSSHGSWSGLLRSRVIGDFRDWKNVRSFEKSIVRLLRALRSE